MCIYKFESTSYVIRAVVDFLFVIYFFKTTVVGNFQFTDDLRVCIVFSSHHAQKFFKK